MNKVSVICTIKNEGKSIAQFLDGLLAQSLVPDEIVLVDGGSTDDTVASIERYVAAGAPLTLLQEPGASRARGRNLATCAANYEIIACTDVGCIPRYDWLERLTAPFEDPEIQAVGGFYRPQCTTRFEVCAGVATCPGREHIDTATWLPTTRSLAYTRAAWAKVGGFDDNLREAEDAPFVASLRRADIQWAWALDAIVLWRPRSTLRAFLRQHTLYAYGDGISATHVRPHIMLTTIYTTGMILLAMAIRARTPRRRLLLGGLLGVGSSADRKSVV